MWSFMEHMPADAQQFGHWLALIAVLWIAVVLVLGVIALLKAKPDNVADVIEAFSHWWRR
jgi:L-asparagine transporter-like permease